VRQLPLPKPDEDEPTGIGSLLGVQRTAPYTVAGDCGDDAVGIHFADAEILGVGNIDIAYSIDSYGMRRIQLRLYRWSAVTGISPSK